MAYAYVYAAMAFRRMKRNCSPTRPVFVARLAETAVVLNLMIAPVRTA
jgi:hypothetical protein